ncbi:MAG: 3-deoxy-7-phosphoheptulonate synthase AroG [Psychromonas sp.]|nr:3-deoxy-7-phosphoheptulonate synthase AroG [Psychromonas sp.]
MINTDDIRIKAIKELLPPVALLERFPITTKISQTVVESRQSISDILRAKDDRLLVIIGPCSIHGIECALEYAGRLTSLRKKYKGSLEIIMRTYFEKPRTTVGWKGLINDPQINDTFNINEGLRICRKLLLEINAMDLPTATEFLDMIIPQYIGDLMAWGAIGARTTESQVHRELASGLSCPVGFKNGTDGSIKVAVDAIGSANSSHHFLSVNKFGHSAIVETHGNKDSHLILRGGKGPNYSAKDVALVKKELNKARLNETFMIDFSHGNSEKKFENQMKVCTDVCSQIANGEKAITGVMVESHLVEGRQNMVDGVAVIYGQSITDACIGWQATEVLLEQLSQSVSARRA